MTSGKRPNELALKIVIQVVSVGVILAALLLAFVVYTAMW